MSHRRYMAAFARSTVATAAAYLKLQAGAKDFCLRRLSVRINAASADTSIGLVRAATPGTVTGAQNVTFAPSKTRDPAATTTLETAWSAAPTIAGTPLWLARGIVLTAATTVVEWSFEHGELVVRGSANGQPGEGLLLWNFGGGGSSAAEVSASIDEFY